MKQLIDENDKKILEVLKESSNLSTHKISRKTLIPVTTINNRIKKLRNLGIIKKYTVEIDKKKTGFNLSAYIFIKVSLRELKQDGMTVRDLINLIKKNPNIESIDNVTGDVDIILKINAKNINEINDYVVNTISGYKGIDNTKTSLVLE